MEREMSISHGKEPMSVFEREVNSGELDVLVCIICPFSSMSFQIDQSGTRALMGGQHHLIFSGR